MNKYSREDVYDTPEKKLKRDLDLSNKIFLERKNALFEVIHNLRSTFGSIGWETGIEKFMKMESEDDRKALIRSMIEGRIKVWKVEFDFDERFEAVYEEIKIDTIKSYELKKYLDDVYSNINNRDVFVDWLYKSGNNVAIKQQIWFMEWYAKAVLDKIKEIKWVDYIIKIQELLNKTSIHKRNIYDLLNGENRFSG